ncbi:hypothetical protein NJ75_04630 [Novosphingobium subterraneum]|uniref:Uncharacterized protein n=1 Tax=Novosphingobium subterraneum TaxID=48936 RepID=A0A0B8ZF16_9SPHN|nr:hypothetical protein NJ75_04630 [Novosphingobium subterraneum]
MCLPRPYHGDSPFRQRCTLPPPREQGGQKTHVDKTNHIGYTPRPQVRRGHKANPLLSFGSRRCGRSLRRDRCGRCAAGSTRGVKPKTHRANPVVTQGQTGQPRADSTAPNPERRCGCGTRHDLRDNVGANDRFFSRSRLPEAKAVREPLPRLRPFTCVRPQAEPTRGPEPPPGHSHPVPRPPRCVPQRHRTGRAICELPPALRSAFASG